MFKTNESEPDSLNMRLYLKHLTDLTCKSQLLIREMIQVMTWAFISFWELIESFWPTIKTFLQFIIYQASWSSQGNQNRPYQTKRFANHCESHERICCLTRMIYIGATKYYDWLLSGKAKLFLPHILCLLTHSNYAK